MHKHTRDGRHTSRPSLTPGVLALVVALVIGLIVPAPAAAQLQLLNGNFENNPLPGSPIVTALNYVDPGSPTGPLHNTWKVTHGDINVGTGPAATTCQAGPASHCVDLNGNGPGRIEQFLGRALADQTCTVTFWMSRHAQLASGSATLRTFVNNAPTSPGTFVHNLPGVTTTNGQWEQKSFTFSVAAGSSDTLALESAVSGAAGPQVDNVAMKCVDVVHQDTTVVTTDPCCPPWNATDLANQMVYVGTGGIGSNYTLHWTPSATQNAQLTAYIAYLHTLNSAFNTISIDFKLLDAGNGALPSTTTTSVSGTSTPSWNGSGPMPVPSFFNAGAMHTNEWYTIQTRIYLNGGLHYFSDKCTNVEISVRIQVQGMAPNTPGGGVLQIRMANGQIIERKLQR
jgi:hypothetical protein